METKVYNQTGKEVGKVSLPEAVFGLPWNADLVHQVIVSMQSTMRNNVAHTKTRGEVSGGGKKPWRQKGTGRARHGSIRSPIWVGGGVAHGPRNDKNYDRKINRKMKVKALYTIISQKMRDGEVIFLDNLKLELPKTKLAVEIIKNVSSVKGFEQLKSKKANAAIVAIPEKSDSVRRGFNNISSIVVEEVRNMNPLSLVTYKYVLIADPKSSLEMLSGKSAK